METVETLRVLYWVMAGVGTFIVVALLIFGGDHDVGHGAAAGLGHDAALAVDHDVHIEHAGHAAEAEGGPGPVSLRTLMAFVGGWGWGGLIGLDGMSWGIMSLPFGAAMGFVMAVAVFQFMKFLHAQEATTTIGIAHMIGQEGVVLTTIPPGGTGEVRISVRATTVKSLARADSSEEIVAGSSIRVVEEIGGTLVVRQV